MEREENIAGDAPQTGGRAQSGATIKGAGKPGAVRLARLWRNVMNRWIGCSQDLSLASLARGGLDAPPPPRDMTP